ncbi:hypothetical protein [Desulfomicrobium salsuginis]
MIRIIALALILASASAEAGFKMFGPNGQYMNSTSPPQPAKSSAASAETYAPHVPERPTAPVYRSDPEDNVDMSGVEWRQSRGAYSGRNSEYTKPFGYRAGVYTLEYTYKGRGNFIVWMHTRKGQKDLVLNNIGAQRGERTVVLKADDEIFFDVLATGNWAITFERKR